MLGYIQGNKPYFYRASTRKHTVDSEFDISKLDALPQVDIVYGYANVNPVALNALVAAGAKGSSTPAWATAACRQGAPRRCRRRARRAC
jgi:L-asparaginase/Glu-tRNA(Gln) amidotransferase subunit D